MRILIQMSHPAHFHLFKNIYHILQMHGHEVHVVIKKKDILEDLLKAAGMAYTNIQPVSHRKNKLGIAYDTLIRVVRMYRYVRIHNIDLLIGCSAEVAQVGWLACRHRINMGEDDANIIPQLIRLSKPFVEKYYAPVSCNTGILEYKTIHYAGYHKLAYLHPDYFTPQKDIAAKYVDLTKSYFLLRFAELKAYHDINRNTHGISPEIAQRLIEKLLPHGNVYISSERPLEPQLEQYRLNINPLDIHHVMAFATLFVGDSQSMAVEAAMLGIPSVRFNNFAGRIGVLEELEHTYGLTFGINDSHPEEMYNKVDTLINTDNLTGLFQSKRERMLKDKIDVSKYMVSQIEQMATS